MRVRLYGVLTWCVLGWVAGSRNEALGQQSAGPGCAACHEDVQKKAAAGAHAPVGCAACHEKHETYPHPAGVPKPACTSCHTDVAAAYAGGVHGQAAKKGVAGVPDCGVCHGGAHELVKPALLEFRKGVLDTCGMCHSDVADEFRASVHGKAVIQGIPQAPLCSDCHGEHSIQKHTLAASLVHPEHIRETCGRCHGDLRLSQRFGLPRDRVVSFDESFHGLAHKAGSQTVANCASCHGFHNILPSSDPKSTIHAKNLPATCGHCHPGAGRRFGLGTVHQVEGQGEPAGVVWVRRFYLLVIPLTIGLMALHNLGDWLRKLARLRFSGRPAALALAAAADPPQMRMYVAERVQHAALAVSFFILAWTGFALKYPEQWWARPLLIWEGSWPVRSWIHRGAAVVFTAVALAHLISLAASPRLREHWKTLLPKWRDAGETWRGFLYRVGLIDQPPFRSAHSYVEKAEYWAVVWGAVIMGLTGFMLWANNLVLAALPKAWLDVATAIHFYEAVLATVAIAVWHFYTVIFDPDVYPLDTAWLTGMRQHPVGEREPTGL